MLGDLENEFELLLEKEAIRIMGLLLIKYNEKQKVNQSLSNLVFELAKKDYKYFSINLFSIVKEILPKNLEEDLNGIYAFVTKEEHRNTYLTKNAKEYLKRGKDYKSFSNQIADLLIEYCLQNPECEDDLVQLIVRNINNLMPNHNDSVDFRTILMYLQENMMNRGYIFISIAPLRLKKISN